MKILHVAETMKGGVATVLGQLISSQNNKFKIILLLPDSQLNELDKIDGYSYTAFRRTGRNLKSFFSLFIHFIRVFVKEKPDVVHIHSTFAGVICRISLILIYPFQRAKIIYCPHAFSFLSSVPPFRKFIYVLVEKILLCITDKIICTSFYEKNQAVKVNIKKSKLIVIYNGISCNKKKVVSPYKKNAKKQILFVGRFDKQKGYDRFLYLMRNLNSNLYDFNIIGEGVHDKVGRITADNIHYFGWMKYDSIIPYFMYSTVLIMPSRWESFGLVAVEAQSFGLPVIANRCSSLPEVILEGETGYLFDFNTEMDNIIKLLNENSIIDWEKMKNDCIAFVNSRFSAKIMNSKVEDLYYHLIYKEKESPCKY